MDNPHVIAKKLERWGQGCLAKSICGFQARGWLQRREISHGRQWIISPQRTGFTFVICMVSPWSVLLRSKLLQTEENPFKRILQDEKAHNCLIEGSLEAKLPTIWTDGKAQVGRVREEKRREEKRSEKRREEKKKDDQKEKVSEERRSRCAKIGRKSRKVAQYKRHVHQRCRRSGRWFLRGLHFGA